MAILSIEEARVKVKSFLKYYIDVKVGGTENGQAWRFTRFYGDPNTRKCKK